MRDRSRSVRKRAGDRRLVGLNLLRILGELIPADCDRLGGRCQRVPDDGVVLAGHEEDAHGGLVLVADAENVIRRQARPIDPRPARAGMTP